MHNIFITGGTGYLGRALIPSLLARGQHVTALARAGSEHRLPQSVKIVSGDALAMDSYTSQLQHIDTFIHLIGVAHPGPAKAAQFKSIDQHSVNVAASALRHSAVKHVVYVSVAQPAPVMQAYIDARIASETLLRDTGIPCTFIRPWYVLGPEHRWPYLLLPVYWLLAALPFTRERATRLGLVTLAQMVTSLIAAIETPTSSTRIITVPDIRAATLPTA